MKKLLAALTPPSLSTMMLGGGLGAVRAGMISDKVWMYLWPSLVALLYFTVALSFFVLRLHKWIWPFLAGFVVQLVGILFIWSSPNWGPSDALWYSLGTTGLGIVVVLLFLLIAAVRTRLTEAGIINPPGALDGDQEEIQRIRENMAETLTDLRKSGLGRNAVYELPWFLVAGCSGVGKTVAIKNSGLGLPVKKDRIKGVGGTLTPDYFFTYEMIFLDTPGKWTEKGLDTSRENWTELLRLLRKNRGRRPLDGVIIVVPADHLMGKTEDELRGQASNIREIINLVHEELQFRFPVYVVVSKCDLVEGFVEFFRGLHPQQRNEILGWSNTDPTDGDAERLVHVGMKRVLRRLQAYRMELLAATHRVSRARRLFFFADEFRRLEEPLAAFVDEFFMPDRRNQPPVFRGFYFSSGMQGDGSPVALAMAELARKLGVRQPPPQETEEDAGTRPYFLLDLFKETIVGDQGLVERTAQHWWRRRRGTKFAAFLPAGAAAAVLFFSVLSLALNKSTYEQVKDHVPAIWRQLHEQSKASVRANDLPKALESTRQLVDYHRDLTGFSLFRGFGMRRPGDLPADVLESLRDGLTWTVLDPTLDATKRDIAAAQASCTEQVELLRSVVWLASGARALSAEDELRGIDQLWLPDERERDDTHRSLVDQFSYLANNKPTNDPLLAGISLPETARRIRDACQKTGSGSSLEAYREFQTRCDGGLDDDASDCYDRLRKAINLRKEDYGRLGNNLSGLDSDLAGLKGRGEAGAAAAREVIREISTRGGGTSACLKDFNERVLPKVDEYFEQQKKLAAECESKFAKSGDRKGAVVEVKQQEPGLKPTQDDLLNRMGTWNEKCDTGTLEHDFRLEPQVLFALGTTYRRVVCTGDFDRIQQTAHREQREKKLAPAPKQHEPDSIPKRQPGTASAPVDRSEPALQWIARGSLPGRQFTARGLEAKKRQWTEDLETAETIGGAQGTSDKNKLEEGIAQYARNFGAAWIGYLKTTKLSSDRGLPTDEWLGNLVKSGELKEALDPVILAAQAVQQASSAKPEFQPMEQAAQDLVPVANLANQNLGEYVSTLLKIASALEGCRRSSAECNAFRSGVESRSPSNPLVMARSWVQEKVVLIADGALTRLFEEPLDRAQAWVTGAGGITTQQWKSLQSAWPTFGELFPFSGKDSKDVAKADVVETVLGPGGSVRSLGEQVAKSGISGPPAAWMGAATRVAEALYRKQGEPAQLRLKITFGEPTWEPAKLGENHRIEELAVYFGEDSQAKWSGKEPDKKESTLVVELFPEVAAAQSFVKVKIQKKNKMRIVPGIKEWGDGEVKTAQQVEGVWSALELLEKGLPDGSVASDRLEIAYPVLLTDPDDKKPEKVVLHLKAEAAGLAQLLALRKNGLKPPPDLARAE